MIADATIGIKNPTIIRVQVCPWYLNMRDKVILRIADKSDRTSIGQIIEIVNLHRGPVSAILQLNTGKPR